jgi:autoinducer 2 (AI-2) kinase
MRLLITAEIDEEALGRLRQFYTVEYRSWRRTGKIFMDSTEFAKAIKEFNADALIVEPDFVDDYLIQNCDLKIIGSCRGNPNNIDIELATKKGIPVVHSPARNADSVADLTLGLIISLLRKAAFAFNDLKAGRLSVVDDKSMVQIYNIFTGSELGGQSFGILGMGAIGTRVATRLRGFGVSKILYYDPYVPESDPKIKGLGTNSVTLDTLLAESDVVSIHAKVTEENVHLVSRERLGLMKPSAHLVNTARSALVDEDALFDLLSQKKIAGAALDVSDQEPIDSSNRFLKLDNVIVTPHIGGSTVDVIHRQSSAMADDFLRFAQGERPVNLVNPQIYEGR